MSLTTPTTKDVNDNLIAALEASINQTIPLLPKSALRVISKALSGLFIIIYKYAGFSFLQMFIAHASFKPTIVNGVTLTPLIELGTQLGAGTPDAAVQAQLIVDITVLNQGGTIAAGVQLLSLDNGVTYTVLSEISLNAATVQGTVIAAGDQSGGSGAGALGNLVAGAVITFAETQLDVAADTVVNSTLVTGANAQSEESYRSEVLSFSQARPRGGAYSDYRVWALEVPGITNVYPYTGNPGQVNVYSEASEASSGSPDGIPTAAQLIEVDDAIQLDDAGLASNRPAGAFINSLPISRVTFDISIYNLVVNNISSVEQDIENGLKEFYFSREPFISGLSVPPRIDRISQPDAAGVVSDIVNAAGGTFDSLLVKIGGVVNTLYALQEGEKAKLGTVDFI